MICKECNSAEATKGPWCAPCHVIGLAAEREAINGMLESFAAIYAEERAKEGEEQAHLEALYLEQLSSGESF